MESRTAQTTVRAPDARRALDALDWAVVRAERGAVVSAEDGAVVSAERGGDARRERVAVVSAEDFRDAAEKYLPDLRSRLDRVVMSRDAEAGLDALLESGALGALLPEVEAMVGFGDGEWRHKDVWKHTKQVVRQAVPRLEVRWAALLHDIGKVRTRSISSTGEVHFFGHAEVGARMFDKLDRRVSLFRSDQSLRSSVRFLILHHLRASQYEPTWTDSAVRRFAREMGPCIEDLLALSRADITTKRPEKKRRGLRQITELAERVREIEAADAKQPPLPSGIGDAIMKSFGLPPSRRIGDLKRDLEKAVEAGEVPGQQGSELYIEFMRDHPERFGL